MFLLFNRSTQKRRIDIALYTFVERMKVSTVFVFMVITCLVSSLVMSFSLSKPSILLSRQSLSMSLAPSIETLQLALKTGAVDRAEVIKAAQELEKKKQKIPVEAIGGKWQLVFTNSQTPFESGFLIGGALNGYFASKEVITFCDENELITLNGSFFSRYQGPSAITSKNPLTVEYVFKHFKVGPIGQDGMAELDRAYQFIYADETMIVARVLPVGALALLKKVR